MPRFLFRFGFQPPELFGSELEDSHCVWVEAPSEEAALAWGREIADAFVRERWPGLPSWKESNFAAWIESEDQTVLDWANRHPVPACRVGDFPDWQQNPG